MTFINQKLKTKVDNNSTMTLLTLDIMKAKPKIYKSTNKELSIK